MAKEDYVIENGMLKKYSGIEQNVEIPDGVSEIGYDAFSDCDVVTIEVPETVQCIYEGAIWKCDNLSKIIFKGKLPDIKDGAIMLCNNLKLPEKLFHTEEKLPVGLIDCIRNGKETCNIAASEVAWIVLFQGNRKWKKKVEELLFLGGVDAEAVGMEICTVLSNYPNIRKKMKDVAIQFMADNCLYKCLIILVDRYLNLTAKEMDSYSEKYDDDKIIKIFQMLKQQKLKNNEIVIKTTETSDNMTLSNARKNFKLRNADEGIIIRDYIGNNSVVTIPSLIDGKKVVGVEARTFFAKKIEVTGLEREPFAVNRDNLINANCGDSVKFGRYCFENDATNNELQWKVLKKEDNRILLITEYVIDVLPFNKKHTDSSWENCDLRQWLNEIFWKYAFSAEEKSFIQTVELKNSGNKLNIKESADTVDKVFLLSLDEVLEYFGETFNDSIKRYAYPTPYAKSKKPVMNENICRWWLRTPGKDKGYIAVVAENGLILGTEPNWSLGGGFWDNSDNIAIRPAIWINRDMTSITAR